MEVRSQFFFTALKIFSRWVAHTVKDAQRNAVESRNPAVEVAFDRRPTAVKSLSFCLDRTETSRGVAASYHSLQSVRVPGLRPV